MRSVHKSVEVSERTSGLVSSKTKEAARAKGERETTSGSVRGKRVVEGSRAEVHLTKAAEST